MRINASATAGLVALSLLAACKEDRSGQKPTPRPAEAEAAPGEGKMLSVGAQAPDFETVAHDGRRIKLSDLRGKPVVLYFYPKDETPGCNAEAEAFRDDFAKFEQMGVHVLGVSLDTIESHKEFAKNHGLQFPLIADAGGAIAARYGVSTRSGFAERVTFIIGADGRIARVFPEVQVSGHSAAVIAALQEVNPAPAGSAPPSSGQPAGEQTPPAPAEPGTESGGG